MLLRLEITIGIAFMDFALHHRHKAIPHTQSPKEWAVSAGHQAQRNAQDQAKRNHASA